MYAATLEIFAKVDFAARAGKRDLNGVAEGSWNGPSPSWMEQLGGMGSVNSDMANQHNVSRCMKTCFFVSCVIIIIIMYMHSIEAAGPR